jgi:NAD(P)-dependent dehydrogenase (short-subunit alcohol dehydrogenase family)
MMLKEQVALVTGAGSGIGRAIAWLFAAEGAVVALADRNLPAAEEAAAQIRSREGSAAALPLDVLQEAQVRGVVAEVLQRFQRLDILVNCAGVLKTVPFLELTSEEWDRQLGTNARGAFLVSQAAARHMVGRRSGRIINIASDSGVTAFPGEAAYSASKAALIALTRAIALELEPFGIRCNAICPGAIRTPLLLDDDPAGAELEKTIASRTPLGRIGEPEEIAKVALFLACGLSEFVTGVHLLATGGYTMR